MIIVCDLDGVVFNSENIVRTEAELFDILEYNGKGIMNKNQFTTYMCYGWNTEQIKKFQNYIYPDVGFYCDVMPGAKKVLELLKHEDNTIYAVTKRGFFGQDEIDLTEKKLKEENLLFDGVFYNKSNKVQQCKDLKADIVIEDNYEHILNLIEVGIKCIYLRDISQPQINHDLVIEVHNWGEIYRHLMRN